MLAEMTARNNGALTTLVEEHGVDVRPLPPEVLAALKVESEQYLAEAEKGEPLLARAAESIRKFRVEMLQGTAIAEQAFLNARSA